MQLEDLKNKSTEELKELLAQTMHELQNLRFQAHGRQLKQVHKINLAKKVIARVSMLLEKAPKGSLSGQEASK